MCTFLSSLFSNNKTKSLFTPWKLGSIKKSKYWFFICIETFDWYLFQLIFLLKPDFNCSNSFALTGTQIFVSVILNFVSPAAEEITQFSGQVKVTLFHN